jgi:hypothetical protein
MLLVAFIGYSSISSSATVSSTVDNLNGEFSFSEGNQLATEVKAQFGQIDNFLRSNEDKQETNYIEISPKLFIQTQGAGSLFQLQVKANYFTFDEFSNDDHYDFSVLSKFHLRFAESQKVFVTGFIADNYEYRGTGLSLGKPDTLEEGDTKRNNFLNAGYLYGHQDSLARAKILVGYRDFDYLTREKITKQLAYSSGYFQGEFDYLISGNTYFSTKIQFEDISYSMNADLERKQYLALAGMKWRSSELTQLHLLLGFEQAAFNNDVFDDENKFAWQVNFLWNPLQRVKLNFSSGSEIKDTYKIVKTVSYSNYYDLGLNYEFDEKIKLVIQGRLVNDEVVSTEAITNEDHFETTTKIQYEWRHWLSGFVQYSYNSFDSTIITYDYDLQAVSAGIAVTF